MTLHTISIFVLVRPPGARRRINLSTEYVKSDTKTCIWLSTKGSEYFGGKLAHYDEILLGQELSWSCPFVHFFISLDCKLTRVSISGIRKHCSSDGFPRTHFKPKDWRPTRNKAHKKLAIRVGATFRHQVTQNKPFSSQFWFCSSQTIWHYWGNGPERSKRRRLFRARMLTCYKQLGFDGWPCRIKSNTL